MKKKKKKKKKKEGTTEICFNLKVHTQRGRQKMGQEKVGTLMLTHQIRTKKEEAGKRCV